MGLPRPFAAALLALATVVLAACAARPPTDPVDAPAWEAAVGGATTYVVADTADSAPDTAPPDPPDTAPPPGPPVVIVVMADDLGDNYLWAMEAVQARLLPESVRFSRAYATVPLCCPVRASFLQGGWYPGQTGVLGNDGPNGGVGPFHDADTLATRLQASGFATALLGKYLNGYEDGVAPYVPPGWDLFLAATALGDFTDTQLVRGSSTPDAAGEGVFEGTGGAHLTGWLFDEALAFLDAHPDEPVFVLLAPQSPHVYGTPAPEDRAAWDGYAPRPPAFAEADVSDKPHWIGTIEVDDAEVAGWDANSELMMENLASLDRGVGALLDGLEARGLVDRAFIVFTSDNGYLHGEHRLSAKGLAYEESVRVPLLVRAPGVAPRTEVGLVAMNLDLPATLAELAGLPDDGEGESLLGALGEPGVTLREHVFLETAFGNHPVWAGVVTERWKYVEWGTGEAELYDLANDPWELDSLHGAPPEDAPLATLAAAVDEHRALNITTTSVPAGAVGVPYEVVLAAWGGTPPLAWAVESGGLPPGLALSAEGVVSGTPTTRGAYTVQVRVTDAGASPVTGAAATWVETFTFSVGAAARATAAREGRDAVFVLPGLPGARVAVAVHLDDTRDGPPLHVADGSVGADGFARLRVRGLDARARAWSWSVEGRPVPGGALPGG